MHQKSARKFSNIQWYRAFPLLVAILATILVIPFLKLYGFENDVNTFYAWMSKLNSQPLTEFYSKDYFADYFPLYLYVLKILGSFAMPPINEGGIAFLKIPSIITNFFFSVWIARRWMEEKKISSNAEFLNSNFIVILILALNPAILYNYAGFSQVDVIFIALCVLAIDALIQKKLFSFAFLSALLISLKPQALFFGPFFALYFFAQFDIRRELPRVLKCFGLFVGVVLALFLPFWRNNPAGVIDHIAAGLASYSYASVNAFNFFAAVNGNWVSTNDFHFLGLNVMGVYFVSLMVSFAFILRTMKMKMHSFNPRKLNSEQLLMIGFIFVLGLFLFFPKMHERYVLAAFPFIYFLAPRSKQMLLACISLSIAATINQSFVIDHFYWSKNGIDGPIIYGCFWMYLFSYLSIHWEFEKSFDQGKQEPLNLNAESVTSLLKFKYSSPSILQEWRWILVIFLLAVFTTFHHLGTTEMISTGDKYTEPFEVRFSETKKIKSIWVFSKGAEGKIYVRCKGQTNDAVLDMGYSWYYAWKETALSGCEGPVSVRADIANGAEIGEFLFYSDDNKAFKPSEICFQKRGCQTPEKSKWFDEFELGAYKNNFLYGTYFDEVYYARAVEEILKGKYPWENTHPALSKFLMTWWVQLTAFEPFYWRFPNALFGVLVPIVVFLMSLRLLGSRFVAVSAGLLTTFEWSRITLSRIATIDIMVCFFMLMSYWFAFEVFRVLYRSIEQNRKFKLPFLKCLVLSLSLSGGLAIKWNSVFTFVTISGLFAVTWLVTHLRFPKVWRINVGDLVRLFVFFLVIPLTLYWISFQPFHLYLKDGYNFARFLQDQVNMYVYHSTLKATHSFSSVYWSWPFIHKPMWFYTDSDYRPGEYLSIAVMGNPIVWWSIFPVIAYMFYANRMQRYPGLVFFFIGFCAQFFTWIFASRITFNYHFLPSVILATPILGAYLRDLYFEKRKTFYAAVSCAALLSLMFWPIVAGEVVSRGYVDKFLKWFPSWYF